MHKRGGNGVIDLIKMCSKEWHHLELKTTTELQQKLELKASSGLQQSQDMTIHQ